MKVKEKNYPECKKTEYSEEYFGYRLEDPYRWLQDAKSPEVLNWVREENEFTSAWFDKEELADKIAELKSKKLKPLYQSISSWKDGAAAIIIEEGEPRVVSLNQRMQNEKVLIRKNDIPLFTPHGFEVCPKNPRFAAIFGIVEGDARCTVIIVDCEKKEILAKFGDLFSYCWSKVQEIVYYAATETDVEAQTTITKVYAYHINTNVTEVIYEDDKNAIIGEVYASSDKKHVILNMMQDYSHSWFYSYSEDDGIVSVINKEPLQMSYVDSMNEEHYFVSKENTQNGCVLAVKAGRDICEAAVICPERNKVLEQGFILDGKVYLQYMKDVCSELVYIEDGQEKVVTLPSDQGTVDYSGRVGNTVYLRFESFLDKPMLLALESGKVTTVLKSSEKEYGNIAVEQKTAISAEDGKSIPYFIVHRKDAELNKNNPTWMYAYGGYNHAMRPFSAEMVTGLDIAEWVEKGGVFVLASIRGGSEYGESWHEEGMLMHKKNCYYDFIGITEQLIRDEWTNPLRIVISGRSNGGLLVSALVTMRPDLFGCVIDSVPHTDMIGFAGDDRGPMYITEYGNPKESKEMFEYLLSYSPYHNVREVNYPPTYIQTGECDNNVPPYHGKKFAAKMQEMNRSGNPILLRVLEKGGHDRGTGEAYWQTVAEMLLFVNKALAL